MRIKRTYWACREAAKLADYYGKIRTAELLCIKANTLRRMITQYNSTRKEEDPHYRSKNEPTTCSVQWYIWYANLRLLNK